MSEEGEYSLAMDIEDRMHSICSDCGHSPCGMEAYCDGRSMATREALADRPDKYANRKWPEGFPAEEHKANGYRGVPKGWLYSQEGKDFRRETWKDKVWRFWKWNIRLRLKHYAWVCAVKPYGLIRKWWFERKGIEYCDHCWDMDGYIHDQDDGRHEP